MYTEIPSANGKVLSSLRFLLSGKEFWKTQKYAQKTPPELFIATSKEKKRSKGL